MTGWTLFTLGVWAVLSTFFAVLILTILTVAWVWRRIAAAWAEERDDQAALGPAPERCWVSPDTELEFEEITAELRRARRTSGEVPPC